MICRIKEVRQAKGISQSELARRSGVCRCMISLVETGKVTNPSLKSAIRISKALNTPIDDLYIFEEDEQ